MCFGDECLQGPVRDLCWDNIGALSVQVAVTCQPDREVAFYPPFDTCFCVLEVGCFIPSGIFLSGAFFICKAHKGPSSRPLSVSPSAPGWERLEDGGHAALPPWCRARCRGGQLTLWERRPEDTGSAWTRTRE